MFLNREAVTLQLSKKQNNNIFRINQPLNFSSCRFCRWKFVSSGQVNLVNTVGGNDKYCLRAGKDYLFSCLLAATCYCENTFQVQLCGAIVEIKMVITLNEIFLFQFKVLLKIKDYSIFLILCLGIRSQET